MSSANCRQPMKKVQSLDEPGGRALARGRGPLMHSVSIVVELATDGCEPADRPGGSDGSPAGLGADSAAAQDHDCQPEELEDEDEDEECLLESELARRVVIVDEADKIFRGRAQSAEPPLGLPLAGPQADAEPLRGRRCESADAPRRHRQRHSLADLAADQLVPIGPEPAAGQLASRRPRHSFACPGQSAARPSSPLAFGGSSELAERGALARLGMRRNTHHQALGEPQHRRSPSAFATDSLAAPARPDRRPATGDQVAAKQQPQQQQQQHQSAYANQNRRQSLQFSLLAGAAIACCHHQTSRSLTEEELRGERQFNEQVRSQRSKSPLGQQFEAQPHSSGSGSSTSKLQAAVSGHRAPPPPLPLVHDPRRRQTCASILAQPDSASPDKLAQQQLQQHHQQPASRRRVSFSSIDPIINRPAPSPTEPEDTEPEQQQQAEPRAAGQAPSEQSSQARLVNQADWLRTCSSCRQNFNPSRTAQTRTILKQHKRHSLATNTVQGQSLLAIEQLARQNRAHASASAAATHSGLNNQATNRPTGAPPADLDALGHSTVLEKSHATDSAGAANCTTYRPTKQVPMTSFGCKTDETDPTSGLSAPATGLICELPDHGQLQTMTDHDTNSTSNNNTANSPAATIAARRQASADSTAGPNSADKQQMAVTNTGSQSCNKSNSNNNNRLPPKHQSKSIGSSDKEENRVQSIMANARLRQEEFARLLEEHEQIVNEINRVETKISNNQTTFGSAKQKPERES